MEARHRRRRFVSVEAALARLHPVLHGFVHEAVRLVRLIGSRSRNGSGRSQAPGPRPPAPGKVRGVRLGFMGCTGDNINTADVTMGYDSGGGGIDGLHSNAAPWVFAASETHKQNAGASSCVFDTEGIEVLLRFDNLLYNAHTSMVVCSPDGVVLPASPDPVRAAALFVPTRSAGSPSTESMSHVIERAISEKPRSLLLAHGHACGLEKAVQTSLQDITQQETRGDLEDPRNRMQSRCPGRTAHTYRS